MSLREDDIPSLVNGISQQPASLRNKTQAELQENCISSIVDGLAKRYPTEHIAKLRNALTEKPFVHFIDRGASEQYVLLIHTNDSVTGGTAEIFDLSDGSSKTINFNASADYLDSSNPRADFRALTINDYTFIVNITKTVSLGTTVPTGTLQGTRQLFTDLPASPTNNDVYRIEGDPNNSQDHYYVKYVSSDAVWREVARPGASEFVDFDASTMPHMLVPNGADFDFDQPAWVDRSAGDIAQTKQPSFVGSQIAGMFLFRGRFGFYSKDNVIMSRNGDLFNFFPDSPIAPLPDDPIDVQVLHDKPANVKRAIAFDETMLLFTDQAQFVVNADGALAQNTISIDITTSFETSNLVDPVASGQNVYFPVGRGDNSAMREYFVEADTVVNDAADVTGHVPDYIPDDLFDMDVSSNEDILLCTAESEDTTQYTYKFFWEGNEKKQSSWSKWIYHPDNEILGFQILKSTMYVVFLRSDGIHLEKMEMSPTDDTNFGFKVLLDHRFTATGVYNAGTNETTFTIPYTWDTDDNISVVKSGSWSTGVGEIITVKSRTTTTVVISGDYSSQPCIIGVPYTARYRLSEIYVRDKEGNPQGGGRLQLKYMEILYDNSGYFAVEVTPEGRPTNTYKFTGKVLGSTFVLGVPNLASGEFKFPIKSRSKNVTIDFVNDSIAPMFLQSASWIGRFTRRVAGR